jgi:hypothetical protein
MSNHQKQPKNPKTKLFITGFSAVFFVAISTYMIAREQYVGAFISGFMISFIWTINVRKVVAASLQERVIYALGAASGSISGIFISKLFFI